VPSRATIKRIEAGALRFIGDIERQVGSVDSMGSPTAKYELFAAGVRFAITDWRANETVQANTVMSQVTTYITVRYRPGLEGEAPGKMRLKHVSDASVSPPVIDYYDILGAVRDPTIRVGLMLACIKRDSSGFRTGVIP
jgi:hypothetical protein